MDEKRRSKRPKAIDEGSWDCSVCTYKNSPEAFKCEMCDVRKGTSTRKPCLNPQQLQVSQQYAPSTASKKKPRLSGGPAIPGQPGLPSSGKKEKSIKKEGKASTSTGSAPNGTKKLRPPRLKNIDRSSATSMEVTVGNVTVIITDYKPKKERTSSVDTQNNNSTSNSAVTSPVHSPTAVKTEMNGDTDTEDRS